MPHSTVHLRMLLLLGAAAALVSSMEVAPNNSTATATTAAAEAAYDNYDQARFTAGLTIDRSISPPRGGFDQAPFTVCPDPYKSYSLVTRLQVCNDTQGFITGIRYFNWNRWRRHDPVIVCDMTSGVDKCVDIELFDEEHQWSTYRAITNIRVVKAKENFRDWKVVYIAFSFSDGGGYEIGTFNPDFPGLKIEQWYQVPKTGYMCGLNGFYSVEAICDRTTGYLNHVKPCFNCRRNPRRPREPREPEAVTVNLCQDGDASCTVADQQQDGHSTSAADHHRRAAQDAAASAAGV